MNDTKTRISVVDHAKAQALVDLREACNLAMRAAGPLTIESGLCAMARPKVDTFKLVATCGPVRLEHPVKWWTSNRVMLAECESLLRAVRVEYEILAKRPTKSSPL